MPRPSPSRALRGVEFAAVLILAGGVALGFATGGLRRLIPATAAATVASGARAAADLQVIAREPHPVGSVAHDRVRDYLVDRLRAVGCGDVHIQSAIGFDNLQGPLAATVANVACRLRGTGSGPALLLTAHYDAVPRGYGAGDDGAGVASIVEVVRALRASRPLTHDVVVVFTDAEEEGLLGAEAFVDLHPWARDVGTVLNFDARGDAGPVYMFQTSAGNAGLVAALTKVADTRANSLTGEVYRHLPNDTDLSIWLHARPDVAALNFADIDGFTRYHTPSDNVANLDVRVVQQMADYALGVARSLDTTTNRARSTGDDVYFDAPGIGLVHYPEPWALPLMLGTAVALIVLIVTRRRQLTIATVAGAAATCVGVAAVSGLVAWIVWQAIRAIHPGYREILQGDPWNSRWYLLAIAGTVVAGVLALQRRRLARGTVFALAIGTAITWTVVGIAVAVLLPGASYLLEWPLLGALIGAALWPRETPTGAIRILVILLCALPALTLWPPLIRALEIGLTAAMLPACAAMIALVVMLVTLPLSIIGSLQRWAIRASVAVALIALVAAETHSGFSAERKRPDSLLLLHDVEAGKAWWVSYDHAADAWNRPALGDRPVATDLSAYHLASAGDLLAQATTVPPTTDSPLRVISDSATSQGRRLVLHVASEGTEEDVSLYVGGGVVQSLTLNRRALTSASSGRYSSQYAVGPGGDALRYFGVPEEGLDLILTIVGHSPLTLELTTSLPGWPGGINGPGLVRPAEMMSKPFIPTDVTMTVWRLRLD